MSSKKCILRIVIFNATLSITIILITYQIQTPRKKTYFNEQRAYQDIKYQISLGPRTVGSIAHEQFISWATAELNSVGWEVELQDFVYANYQIQNIIATRNNDGPWIILGAHYDSRLVSDRDANPSYRTIPVPGANDGASGVAVLLELARVLPREINKNLWIVLFDAEDNGDIPGWNWILGSEYFVQQLRTVPGIMPDAVVIVDMIGDADLNIYKEVNSNNQLVAEIWDIAWELGYTQFRSEYKYQILDDHIPFLQAGIAAIDIIDIDYLYFHTTQDTLDKVSPESLDAVGESLLSWLLK